MIAKTDTSPGLRVVRQLLLAAAATIGPVALSVLLGPPLAAQVVPPPADAPVFEAASVRPAADKGRQGGRGTPGRFNGFNLPVRRLIRQAYDLHDSQVIGGPDWISSEGFDINATTGDRPPDQMRVMMQTLLRDRFKLAFHSEKRELPTYALVVARSDGRVGPGLRKIPDGECPPPGARRCAPPAGGPPPAPPSPFDPGAQAACGSIVFGPGRLLAHGVPIDMLAESIGNLPAITAFNRTVVNETGLEGQYDFDFSGPTNSPGEADLHRRDRLQRPPPATNRHRSQRCRNNSA